MQIRRGLFDVLVLFILFHNADVLHCYVKIHLSCLKKIKTFSNKSSKLIICNMETVFLIRSPRTKPSLLPTTTATTTSTTASSTTSIYKVLLTKAGTITTQDTIAGKSLQKVATKYCCFWKYVTKYLEYHLQFTSCD